MSRRTTLSDNTATGTQPMPGIWGSDWRTDDPNYIWYKVHMAFKLLYVNAHLLLSAAEEVLALAAEQLPEEQYGRMKSGLDRLDAAVKKARGEI